MSAFFSFVIRRVIILICSLFFVGSNQVSDSFHRTSHKPFRILTSAAAEDTTSSKEEKKKEEEEKRTPRPAREERRKSVKISISDEGITLGSDGEEDDLILELDPQKIFESLEHKLEDLEELHRLQDSLAAVLGDEDDRKYIRVRGRDVVHFAETIHISRQEMVQGDVVSIAGKIIIEGKVRGNVICVLGDIELEPTAIVNGDVVTVLGNVSEDDGARVRGETIRIAAGPAVVGVPILHGGGFFKILAKIMIFIIGTLLLLLIIYFLPDRMNLSSQHVFGSFFKSLGIGILVILLGSIVVGLMIAILSITIIGIPVAILLGLSFAAMIIIGYFASAVALGRVVCTKFSAGSDSAYLHAFIGLFLLFVLGFVANLMWFTPFLLPIRMLLRTLGGFLNFLAVFTGTGALFISKAGTISLEKRPPIPDTIPE
jgi:cytoskeletal protein CcmA (bactofilin family)